MSFWKLLCVLSICYCAVGSAFASGVSLSEMEQATNKAAESWQSYERRGVFTNQGVFKDFLLDVYAGGYKDFGCKRDALAQYRSNLLKCYSNTLLQTDSISPVDKLPSILLVYLVGGYDLDSQCPEEVNNLVAQTKFSKGFFLKRCAAFVQQLNNDLYLRLWRYLYTHKLVKSCLPRSLVEYTETD